MNLRYHRIPRDLFDALAAGGSGPDAIRELILAQYSKHLLLLRRVLDASQAFGRDQAQCARLGYDLLAAVQRRDREAADSVIRHPSVGAWALQMIRASRDDPVVSWAEPAQMSAVAAAAAVRARVPAEIEVPAVAGHVVLPSLGAAAVAGPSAVVRSSRDRAAIFSGDRRVELPTDPYRDAPGWQGLRRIRAGPADTVIDDIDPFRMPASANVASRLSDAEISRWGAILHAGWHVLEIHHPAAAAEVSAMIRVIVPLATTQQTQLSSSSAEAFGAIALSESPNPRTCAVTLVHEVQHLKLSALLDMIRLTQPDDGRRYYAPWRDDPRPIAGLLQGAYAHLGVTGFWRRQRRVSDDPPTLGAHTEFARWLTATMQVVDTLRSSGRLTPAGRDFVRGMVRTLSAWQDEPIPAEARALARNEARSHRARWHARFGTSPTQSR